MEKQITKDRRRKRLQQQLRRFYFNTSPSQELYKYMLCTKETFKEYINSLLQEDMNEENYGTVWELDHIVPVEVFNLDDEEDLKLCYSRYNILPIYKKHNKSKGSSVHFSYKLLSYMIGKRARVEDIDDTLWSLHDRCRDEIIKWQIYFK